MKKKFQHWQTVWILHYKDDQDEVYDQEEVKSNKAEKPSTHLILKGVFIVTLHVCPWVNWYVSQHKEIIYLGL